MGQNWVLSPIHCHAMKKGSKVTDRDWDYQMKYSINHVLFCSQYAKSVNASLKCLNGNARVHFELEKRTVQGVPRAQAAANP